VRRATTIDGDYTTLPTCTTIPVFTDFIGEADQAYHYQVRSGMQQNSKFVPDSDWSKSVSATTQKKDSKKLITEVQEAYIRYFTKASHPESGMAREWHTLRWTEGKGTGGFSPGASGATGMGLTSYIVGVERKFLTREDAARSVLNTLRFLKNKAERYHGAFAHWIDGKTGKTIPFSKADNGGDLAETALLAQGLIIAREYFTKSNATEKEIREIANTLWREIEWDWYRKDKGDQLFWHWSPDQGFKVNLPIMGFCEAEIAYVLAVCSPTHPVPTSTYFKGWRSGWYGSDRTHFDVDLQLGQGLGGCTFWYYYSYIGLDPKSIHFKGRPMLDHFKDLCTVQIRYMRSLSDKYKGYDTMWGLTAGPSPDGYRGHKPGKDDNGTISPPASLSSFLYAPHESLKSLETMYLTHGKELWQETGFVHSFNLTEDWIYPSHLGVDSATVAPMIENARSQLLWKLFMQAPEIKAGLKKLEAAEPGTAPAFK